MTFNSDTRNYRLTACVHKEWYPHLSKRLDLLSFVLAASENCYFLRIEKNGPLAIHLTYRALGTTNQFFPIFSACG
jgi:hypothetical protein